MRVGSLCSGYGGLDLGLELALGPVEHAWFVEYDKHPSAILAHHWPDVPNHGDVKHTDWTQVEPVDWLTAGYPCQPFSIAGSKQGANDERHLWPHVAAAIGALRPRRVLLENVAHHVSLGLDAVLWDLAELGYDARWGVVRASDAGAPHGRARVFVVAADTGRLRGQPWGFAAPGQDQGARPDGPLAGRGGTQALADAVQLRRGEGRVAAPGQAPRRGSSALDHGRDRARAASHADSAGLEGREPAQGHLVPAWGAYGAAIRRWERVLGRPAPGPTEPRGRNGAERLSPAFVEWVMGLPRGWVTACGLTAKEQLKALGNGVVPQQAALALRLLGVTATEAAA